jgi:hypothetical protein
MCVHFTFESVSCNCLPTAWKNPNFDQISIKFNVSGFLYIINLIEDVWCIHAFAVTIIMMIFIAWVYITV